MTREKRLYDATLSGSVESMHELMQEDKLTLARVSLACFNETPLHIAAMLGHTDFGKALLSYKSDLIHYLDSQGRSPLHLASAGGYVEMVKLLLAADSDMCLVRDKDRRAPLHLAIMHGHLDVVKELVWARPQVVSTAYVLDRGETLLHTCVIHNHLEVLKLLVGESRRRGTDEELLNIRDENGFTIFHTAAALKQIETLKFLVSQGSKVRVNAKNGNGLTAVDMIKSMPKDLKTMEILDLFAKAGGCWERELHPSPVLDQELAEHVRSKEEEEEEHPMLMQTSETLFSHLSKVVKKYIYTENEKNYVRIEKERDAIMVAATIIAAMAYQAALNPPGGVWQDVQKVQTQHSGRVTVEPGSSILATYYPNYYDEFWIYNTVSFASSLSIIFLLVCGISVKRRIFVWILMLFQCASLTFMALTYRTSMQAITPGHEKFDYQWASVSLIVKNLLNTWFGLIGLVFLVHTSHLIWWIIKKVRKDEKKMVEVV